MAEVIKEEVTAEVVTLAMTPEEALVLQAVLDIPFWENLGKHAVLVESLYWGLDQVTGPGGTAEAFFGMKRKGMIK